MAKRFSLAVVLFSIGLNHRTDEVKNKQIRNLLIYNHGHACWLNGKLTKKNPLTLHHIKPIKKGGKTTIDNGALLSKSMHERFNQLERHNPQLAKEINKYLKEYKGDYPPQVQSRIDYIMGAKQKIKRR